MVTRPRNMIPVPNTAPSVFDEISARRYRSSRSSKISWFRGSRRNACTARMPASDSVKCTITNATASRVARYAARPGPGTTT